MTRVPFAIFCGIIFCKGSQAYVVKGELGTGIQETVWIVTMPVDWPTAEATCRLKGGRLFQETSNEFLYNFTRDSNIYGPSLYRTWFGAITNDFPNSPWLTVDKCEALNHEVHLYTTQYGHLCTAMRLIHPGLYLGSKDCHNLDLPFVCHFIQGEPCTVSQPHVDLELLGYPYYEFGASRTACQTESLSVPESVAATYYEDDHRCRIVTLDTLVADTFTLTESNDAETYMKKCKRVDVFGDMTLEIANAIECYSNPTSLTSNHTVTTTTTTTASSTSSTSATTSVSTFLSTTPSTQGVTSSGSTQSPVATSALSMSPSTAVSTPVSLTSTTTVTSPVLASICTCSCTKLDEEQLLQKITEIEKKLTVDKKATGASRRAKISADDKRTSSTTIGLMASCVLGVVASFFVLMDIFSLLYGCHKGVTGRRNPRPTNHRYTCK